MDTLYILLHLCWVYEKSASFNACNHTNQAYFGKDLWDQDEQGAPYKVSTNCTKIVACGPKDINEDWCACGFAKDPDTQRLLLLYGGPGRIEPSQKEVVV